MFGAADHLAHGAFGHRLHRAFGILDVEQIFADAVRLDPPQHREIDVDDVLVAGEHQALLRHVAHRGAAAQIVDDAHADVDLVDAQRLRRQRGLDRIGQVIVQAGLRPRGRTCRSAAPRRARRARRGRSRRRPTARSRAEHDQREAAAAEIAARQHAAQLVLAAPQQLLEVGRRRAGRLRPRAPRALAAARSPGPAALIAPWHEMLSSRAGVGRLSVCW